MATSSSIGVRAGGASPKVRTERRQAREQLAVGAARGRPRHFLNPLLALLPVLPMLLMLLLRVVVGRTA